jgi:hypothetical protein
MRSFFPLRTKSGVERFVFYASMFCGQRCYGSAQGCAFCQCHQEAWVGDLDVSNGSDVSSDVSSAAGRDTLLVNVTEHRVLDFGLWYSARGTGAETRF